MGALVGRPSILDDQHIALAMELRTEGVSMEFIAREFKCDPRTLGRSIARAEVRGMRKTSE